MAGCLVAIQSRENNPPQSLATLAAFSIVVLIEVAVPWHCWYDHDWIGNDRGNTYYIVLTYLLAIVVNGYRQDEVHAPALHRSLYTP